MLYSRSSVATATEAVGEVEGRDKRPELACYFHAVKGRGGREAGATGEKLKAKTTFNIH